MTLSCSQHWADAGIFGPAVSTESDLQANMAGGMQLVPQVKNVACPHCIPRSKLKPKSSRRIQGLGLIKYSCKTPEISGKKRAVEVLL